MTTALHAAWPDPTASRQREFHRTPIQVEVTLNSGHNFYTGITENISEGGLFVCGDELPAIGTVEVLLVLPDSPRQHCLHGTVRWVRYAGACAEGIEPGFGLEWIDMPDEALIAISHFVRQRSSLLFEV